MCFVNIGTWNAYSFSIFRFNIFLLNKNVKSTSNLDEFVIQLLSLPLEFIWRILDCPTNGPITQFIAKHLNSVSFLAILALLQPLSLRVHLIDLFYCIFRVRGYCLTYTDADISSKMSTSVSVTYWRLDSAAQQPPSPVSLNHFVWSRSHTHLRSIDYRILEFY